MYIDADTIIKAASLLTAVGALVGVIVAIYKIIDQDRRQSEIIKEMQAEQTILCYGLRGFFV